MREKKKKVERENVEFRHVDTKIPLPNSTAWVWGVRGVPKVKRKKKKFWQTNCGNAIAEIGKKNCNNCGNGIPENGGKINAVPKSRESKKKKVLRS